MHMPQDANEEFKLYFASFFKMSICVRDFSNKEGVRLGDCLTQFQKNLPEWGAWGFKPAPVSGLVQLFFQVVSHLSRGMTHGSWAWSMVLNPGGQRSGQRRGHRWIPTQWPSVISCAPCPAAHHRPRAGLRAAWRGMDWSWVQKISTICSFPVLVGWFLLVADFWVVSCIYIYTCFSKYWISSAILVEHFPKVWQGTNLRPWTTTLPITRPGQGCQNLALPPRDSGMTP